jgi:hypothetical protein
MNYFVVIDSDEPYYNEGEYHALWILPLGLMTTVGVFIFVGTTVALCRMTGKK